MVCTAPLVATPIRLSSLCAPFPCSPLELWGTVPTCWCRFCVCASSLPSTGGNSFIQHTLPSRAWCGFFNLQGLTFFRSKHYNVVVATAPSLDGEVLFRVEVYNAWGQALEADNVNVAVTNSHSLLCLKFQHTTLCRGTAMLTASPVP